MADEQQVPGPESAESKEQRPGGDKAAAEQSSERTQAQGASVPATPASNRRS